MKLLLGGPGGLAPRPGSGARPQKTQSTETEIVTEPEAEVEEAAPKPVWRRLPALLLAAIVLLTGLGVWFTIEARSASGTPAAANRALTDVGETAEVTSAVTQALNRIFSYSYDKTDVTEKMFRDPIESVIERTKSYVQHRDDPLSAVIQGVDDAWEVCLLKFTVDMIERSSGGNIGDFRKRGLI